MRRLQGIGIGFFAAVLLFNGVAVAASVTKTIDVTYRNIKLAVNGREFVPKDVNNSVVEPFIYNGTTYVPIRAVSQALNQRVTWDGDTSTVYIGISNDVVVWRADLNHDGVDDKIVLEPYIRDHSADLGAVLTVYTNDTDIKLFSAEDNVAHVGWDGFYLYKNGDNTYLFNWRPAIYTGTGNYEYEIFSFNENGEKNVFDSGSYEFEAYDFFNELEAVDEFISYIRKVNNYLIQSYLLVDTDKGYLMYGAPDSPHAEPFIPAWLFSD